MRLVLIGMPRCYLARVTHLSLGVLASWLLAAAVHAQSTTAHHIGFLSPASPASMEPRLQAFRAGLRELGYQEGDTVTIEYRWGEGRDDLLTKLAAELAQRKVKLVLAHGVLAAQAARNASSTIIAPEISGKRLQLLREVIPGLSRIAVMWNRTNPVSALELKETESAARSFGMQIQSIGVVDGAGVRAAFSTMANERAQALLVCSDAMLFGQRQEISDLAMSHRLPTISWTGDFARAGSLMGYGPDVYAIARRAAIYVDKILKGANPADLPIEQPTRIEFVVNLKTAKALARTIPQSLLLRADQVVD